MAYLRVYSPDLPADRKRELAKNLTDAVMRALKLPEWQRNQCAVHFISSKSDAYAVNAKTTEDWSYNLDVTYSNLDNERKGALVSELTPVMMKTLRLKPGGAFRINMRFYEQDAGDFAVGGRFAGSFEKAS